MEKIYITSNSVQKYEEIYYMVDSNWYSYFEKYQLVSLPNDLNLLKNYFNSTLPRSIVLSGGGNIVRNSLSEKDHDKKREEVEEFLIKFATNNNIPLIAICRGMQKVVSYFNKDVIFVENNTCIKGNYQIDNPDLINISNEKLRTCFNNYSIQITDSIQNNWNVLQLDENRNLLCAEHKKYKILCFMWHPERDQTDFQFINSFIK